MAALAVTIGSMPAKNANTADARHEQHHSLQWQRYQQPP
jgi:hypothetical protein